LSPAEEVFAQRYLAWKTLHRLEGAGRSYPYAWRLPELARPLGKAQLDRAQHALALDLYTLGRFGEALRALPGAVDFLGRRLGVLLDQPLPHGQEDGGTCTAEEPYLAYLKDNPRDWPSTEPFDMQEEERLWAAVLRVWSLARRGLRLSLRDSHRALARLRHLHPTLAAQAEAVYAETVFCLGPRWAAVWLDHALDQVDLFSQHHLKARLLGLKARALEAAGELGEGARFRKQARALAERQGARLYMRLFIDPT